MHYYIATSLLNAHEAIALHSFLKGIGWTPTYDWTSHGSAPERAAEISIAEANAVLDAEVVFVILPGRAGTHSELGMAIAHAELQRRAGRPPKRIILIGDQPEIQFRKVEGTCAFYWHWSVTQVAKQCSAALFDGLIRIGNAFIEELFRSERDRLVLNGSEFPIETAPNDIGEQLRMARLYNQALAMSPIKP